MNGRSIALLALMCGALLSCKPATEEDRKALTGLWNPDDGSLHAIEFKPDGVFDFVYDAGRPRVIWRGRWVLDTKGKVEIRGHDGARYKTCRYSIDAGKLTIDNGDGLECLRATDVRMPTAFTRSP